MNKDCLFCKIINREVPANILYEDEDILVFLDAFPDVEGHTLVIPKKHYEDILEVSDETLIKMYRVGKEMSKKLMDNLGKNSLTYLINYGEAQAIKHIHLHLLPDYGKKVNKMSKEEVFAKLK